MIDVDGYRANVGIILCNQAAQVMWAKRIGQDAWQFPQGGISAGESPVEAMYRELWEETGLKSDDVDVLGSGVGSGVFFATCLGLDWFCFFRRAFSLRSSASSFLT